MTEKTTAGRQRAPFLDTGHPFYRRIWVRIATVAVACGWGLFELAQGQIFWAIVFLGLGLYAGWRFLVASGSRNAGKDR